LKNFSNTKYMSAGAAYGDGVYFATHMSISLEYCNPLGASTVRGWPHSRFGSSCTFMALCELINRPEEYAYYTEKIMVVPKEEYISTRYFLVNPRGAANSRSLQINLVSTLCLRTGATKHEAAGESEDGGEMDRKRGKWDLEH
jgi:hypothetical protein